MEFGLCATPKNASGNTLQRRHPELRAELFIVLLATCATAKNAFFPVLLEIRFLFFSLCFNSSASLYYGLSDARVIFLPAFQIFVKTLKASLSCPSAVTVISKGKFILTPVVPDLASFHTYVLSIDTSLEVATHEVRLNRGFNSQQAALWHSPGNICRPQPIFHRDHLL